MQCPRCGSSWVVVLPETHMARCADCTQLARISQFNSVEVPASPYAGLPPGTDRSPLDIGQGRTRNEKT